MTVQQQMKATLSKSGIPAKEIKCYGSQIMVTAWGRETAVKWADLLGKLAKVNVVKESHDYNTENSGTNLNPTTHAVWLVWATV